jgi:uncharacterized protein
MPKIILIIVAWATLAVHAGYKVQNPHPRVMDNEHDLDSAQTMALESLYEEHERRTTNQIALITTASYYPDSTLLAYGLHKFNELGVGRSDINNGILVVFSKTHHEVRIVTGYGTEKVLKDDIAKRIIDSQMIPEFKKDSTFRGLWLGSKAVVEFLEKPENRIR